MQITTLTKGDVLFKKDAPEAMTPWKVLHFKDGIHVQRVGRSQDVWVGKGSLDVNRVFMSESTFNALGSNDPSLMHTQEISISTVPDLAGGIHSAISRPVRVVTTPEVPYAVDHDLKVDPERLAEIIAGTKTHEIRVFDREFKVGNTLKLNEYDRSANEYTGQLAIVKVTNITAPGSYGLPANLGVMSIELVKAFDFNSEVQSEFRGAGQ